MQSLAALIAAQKTVVPHVEIINLRVPLDSGGPMFQDMPLVSLCCVRIRVPYSKANTPADKEGRALVRCYIDRLTNEIRTIGRGKHGELAGALRKAGFKKIILEKIDNGHINGRPPTSEESHKIVAEASI
ncbi:hypothetical protein HYW59_02540 [Candidatus Kaiserbacteria bacterium]|nr:hypothetical protein [Candidatus Kaiserbacteria bacterium]